MTGWCVVRSWMIAGSLGMAFPAFLPTLPPPGVFAVAGLVAVSLLYSRRYRAGGILLLGAIYAGCLAQWALIRVLPAPLAGQDLQVCGYVEGLPERRDPGWRFRFRLARAMDGLLPGPVVQLYTYQEMTLVPGGGHCLLVRLRPPRGLANPGTFDYERWLIQQGVSATGTVRQELAQTPAQPARAPVATLRDALRGVLARHTDPAGAAGSVLQALTIGDRAALAPATRDLFTRTGTAHLMAISGLHLALVAGFSYLVVHWLVRVLGLGAWLAAPRAAALASLAAALGYGLLSGWGLPVQRAAIMLACALAPTCLGRRLRVTDTLLLAVFLVLLRDPLAVRDGGFWLSFGAVMVLVYAFAGRPARTGPLRTAFRTQLVLGVGMLPLLVGLGLPVSWASLPANLLAVPWTGLLVLPLALAGLLLQAGIGMGAELLAWAECLMALQLQVLTWFAAAAAPLTAGNPVPATLLLAGFGLAWLLAPAGVPARWGGLLLCLPLFAPPQKHLRAGEFEVHVLDVGQGLSVLVETRDRALLYDAGNGGAGRFDLGRAVVAPYLRARGRAGLDLALVSHGDSDHAGGMPAVLAATRAENLLGGEHLPRAAGRVTANCRAGQQWSWNGVRFRVLAPAPGARPAHNNESCVVHVAGSGGSLLLPGDIERRAEHALVARSAPRLRARILVAPHHGSRTSSSPAFVRAVAPELVVFSAGWQSRFGHPHGDVVDRYRRRGMRLLGTAESGAVRIAVLRDGTLEVQHGRRRMPGWWRSPGAPAGDPAGVVEYLRSRYWQGNHFFREGS